MVTLIFFRILTIISMLLTLMTMKCVSRKEVNGEKYYKIRREIVEGALIACVIGGITLIAGNNVFVKFLLTLMLWQVSQAGVYSILFWTPLKRVPPENSVYVTLATAAFSIMLNVSIPLHESFTALPNILAALLITMLNTVFILPYSKTKYYYR